MHSTTSDAAQTVPRRRSSRIPGDLGIWLFVTGDVLVFSAMFLVYSFYRSVDPALFHLSQRHLNQGFGLANTFLLLTSSWFVVIAVRGARAGFARLSMGMFAAALMCGLGFLVSKGLEYSDKFDHGITMMTNDFFMYYFVLTGLHGFHVVLGIAGLGYLTWRARKPSYDAGDIRVFETGATFWHMVDLLWIILFPLLYLVP
ncbi:MAG TPA: cytochrome c oxidase subunit 3 family protein [Allosphingosinicella sp.]|nr:cytochrome c oxidase subunit 3 family protein [Allosphingosinicella sp.]